MNTRFVPAVVLVLAALAISGVLTHQSGAAPDDKAPVPLSDVRERGIAGVLGERLGKVVTIHGTIVKGDTFNTLASAGRDYVKVDRIDDRTLKQPATVLLRGNRLGWSAGQEVTLRGYETGGYSGIVDDPSFRRNAGQDVGYGFYTEFVGGALPESK